MIGNRQPQFLGDRVEVRRDGEEMTVWNNLTVREHHDVHAGQIESRHEVVVGDGSTGEQPEFITPEMADQLMALDVYVNAEVVNPRSDEVEIL
jgi:hypothetical protein